MEVSTQVSYKGYRADYTITSFNSVSYMAELTGFSGFEGDNPPSHFCFVKTRGRVIASSDVVDIVKSLAKQLYSENSIELQEVY